MIKILLKYIRIKILLLLKYDFVSIGKNFYCGKNLIVRPKTVEIGNNVYIGNKCHLSVNRLVIKDFVMLASNVSIVGGDHRYDRIGTPIIYAGRDQMKKVIIETDAWIGHGAIILHGITIGEGAIVAAGSVVTKDVRPYEIVGGNPAKYIKMRFSDSQIKEHKEKILNASNYPKF